MVKIFDKLDHKTLIIDIGDEILEAGINPGFAQLLTPERSLCTHMWTTATAGGTVNYIGVDNAVHTIYMAREMGVFPVLFTKFIAGGTLLTDTLWWARTANYMYVEQV